MRLITCKFPDVLVLVLDELVRLKHFANRSEAIRYSVKNMIKEEVSLFALSTLEKKYKVQLQKEEAL